MLEGRRGRWGHDLKIFFGPDFFNHVVYYDTVTCSQSGRFQRIVITDRDLYLFADNTKVKPKPFCSLLEIQNLGCDNVTPKNLRSHKEYQSVHIFFNLADKQYHIYTFEFGTDLFWRLKNAIEFAKRSHDVKKRKEPVPANMVEMVNVDGKDVTASTYFTRRFNQLSSHASQGKSHSVRMQALKELEEMASQYFPVRTLFFQSTTLLTYLIDTLSFLSDFHAIPPQVKTSRVEQVEAISRIYKLFSEYLKGATSVSDATRLITFNNACHFKTLIYSIFQTEFYILSQPTRAPFFLKDVTDTEKYMELLQEIENTAVRLITHLYNLSILTWREGENRISREFLVEVIKEKETIIVTGGFHTIVYSIIQMCYIMQSIKPLTEFFCHSVYDHLWVIDFFTRNIKSALHLVRQDFLSEFDLVVTEGRMLTLIPEEFSLRSECVNHIKNIRGNLAKLKELKTHTHDTLPVQFR